jgi:hypothetical protein
VPLKSGCENNSPLDSVYSCMRLRLILILALATLSGDAVAQNVAIQLDLLCYRADRL